MKSTWRVPSLSLADEAIELFTDRARLARPDFTVTDDNAAAVTEICRRLDGMPLAIELAAARVRALSLAEILDSLHDRFRLLTGGARTAVRRQQTLRASVDWSHALLTEPERILFRRLAVFLGGFDLDAAQAVAGGDDVRALPGARSAHPARRQVAGGGRKHQRPNAIPAAGDGAPVRAGKARRVRRGRRCARRVTATTTRRWRPCSTRRRAPTTSGASSRPKPRSTTCAPRSRGAANTPTSSSRWRWRRRCSRCGCARGRLQEGLAWFDAALADDDAQHAEVAPAVRARALADKAVLDASVVATDSLDQAAQALAIARELDDPALLARALTACGCIAVPYNRRGGPAVLRRGDRPGPRTRRPVEAEPDPRLAGARRRSSPVTRSRRARPPRKDATSPRRSVTGSTRVCAAGASAWHR